MYDLNMLINLRKRQGDVVRLIRRGDGFELHAATGRGSDGCSQFL